MSTELLSYTRPLTPEYYNIHFNPNLCHVCKSPNNGIVILCDKCCMISYCSLDHKRIHHAEHKNICRIIRTLLEGNSWFYTCRMTSTEWLQSNLRIIDIVTNKIERPLHGYELDMFLYGRSCFACHRRSELGTCNRCFSVNFCADHSQDIRRYHVPSTCKELLVNLNCKIYMINMDRLTMQDLYLDSDIRCFSSMLDFIGNTHSEEEIWATKPWTTDLLSINDYFYSEYISDPLTLYFGMRDANLVHFLSKPICVIHIIFPDSAYTSRIPVWDILFHLLDDEVQMIVITYIVAADVTFQTSKLETCAACKLRKKFITVQTYPTSYKNFVSSSEYRRPNVIIIFNVNCTNTMTECLTVFQDQDCPLLLTFMMLKKVKYFTTYINDTLNIAQYSFIENRFKGLYPRRTVESSEINYRNKYLVTYENLKNSNEAVPCTSHA